MLRTAQLTFRMFSTPLWTENYQTELNPNTYFNIFILNYSQDFIHTLITSKNVLWLFASTGSLCKTDWDQKRLGAQSRNTYL